MLSRINSPCFRTLVHLYWQPLFAQRNAREALDLSGARSRVRKLYMAGEVRSTREDMSALRASSLLPAISLTLFSAASEFSDPVIYAVCTPLIAFATFFNCAFDAYVFSGQSFRVSRAFVSALVVGFQPVKGVQVSFPSLPILCVTSRTCPSEGCDLSR